MAAIVVVAATARGGIKILPVAQAVILASMTVVGFTGDRLVDADLVKYGPGLAGLLLGLFMVATAATMPFTAQFARSEVPPELWHNRRFLNLNRRISTAWGLAVLVLGACHLVGALIGLEDAQLLVRLAVNWVLPLFAFQQAGAYTKRVVATAHAMQERNAS
ncbi:hypothetical protein [Pseudonocardia charpentierae]|uniref:Uncharacterized protein n=1 Tax=Pseudonocardia charpentierae TaxID=3075545 RepID=A0ABU2NIS4_9PSEU|nr:hypothetical protein [Pseudonocardia sp. DSM 45834]MDT0353323.1 hypothetical protein [Pseudonocardia sp. DSM 45834]